MASWTPRMVLGIVYSWESQARQYAETGEPGISYERHYAGQNDREGEGPAVDCLLARNHKGQLIGILNHYPTDSVLEQAGNVNVWVHPDAQKRGVATALINEARKLWLINFQQQRYTPEGLRLLASLRRQPNERNT